MVKSKGTNSNNLKDLTLVGVASLAIGILGTLGVSSLVDGGGKTEKVPEGVVAVLDGKNITSKELYDEMVYLYGSNALESLVSDRLTGVEAKANDIKVAEEDIKKEIDAIKEQYPTEEDYKAVLKESGQTEEDLRKDVVSYLQLVALLTEKIDTSDEALKREFKANKDTYSQKEQVDADHILVKEESEAKEIYEKLTNGGDFKELAKEFSLDYNQDAENGANLGYFGRDVMVEEFENKVFGMKVGEISLPFKTQHGWHIAKVNDKVSPKEAVFEEVKEQVKKKVVNDNLGTAYEEWLLEMKDKYGFENKLDAKPIKLQ